MSSFVVDLSRATATITGAQLAGLSTPAAELAGAIVYAGCDDETKNCAPERMNEYLAHAVPIALVIENAANQFGTGAGTELGQHVLAAGAAIGYHTDNYVMFASADYNAQTSRDYAAILADWERFAAVVPVPGYYGDSDSIDYLAAHATRPPAMYWQSESDSFSPEHPSPHANLWQRFNDPRAGGLDVDVDELVRGPLLFMGADLLSDERAALFRVDSNVASLIGVAQGQLSTGGTIAATLTTVQGVVNTLNRLTASTTAMASDVGAQLSTISAAIQKVQAGQLDPTAFVSALEAAGVPLEIATDMAGHLKLTAA